MCQVRCRSGSDPAARRCGRGSGPAPSTRYAGPPGPPRPGSRSAWSRVGSRPSLSSSHVVRCVPRPVASGVGCGSPAGGASPLSSTGTSNRLDSPDHRPAATAARSDARNRTTPATRAVHAHPDTSAVVRTTPVRPSPAAATRPRACSGSERGAHGQGHGTGGREDEYHRGHPPDHRTPGQRRDQGDEADEGEGDDTGSHLRTGGRHGTAAEQRLGGATGDPRAGRREEQDQSRNGHRRRDRPLARQPRRHDTHTRRRPRHRPGRAHAYPGPPGPRG